MLILLELPRQSSRAIVRRVNWDVAIGTLQVNFCEVGVRFNFLYSFFYCYITKVLRCGIGVYIGKLRSTAIAYEPDCFSVWFWDSPKGTNNSRLHVCYYVIAFAIFLTDLVFYFVAYIACVDL